MIIRSALRKNAPSVTSQSVVAEIVEGIQPFDNLEKEHLQGTLSWIKSGAPLFRIQKPDTPPQHLVSYFVLFDEGAQKILLVDHKKAQLWLPSGGHVELDENPKETVERECFEELNIQADFWCEDPVFITVTKTVGLTAGHTDVSLWYILRGNHRDAYHFDGEEFHGIRWFDFKDIPFEKSDPHMGRFIQKLRGML